MKRAGFTGLLMIASLFLFGCEQAGTAAETSPIWQTDYAAALKQAAEENKYVLVDFSGSDWCSWCMKLEREVFSKPEFIAYAEENLIMVLVDFPQYKAQSEEQRAANQGLANKYGVQGFPTVLVQNPQGKTIERTGYQPGGAENYVEYLKSVIAADQKK